MSGVGARLAEVRARMDAACARAGRASGSVELVAVSKTHPFERVREAWEAGQRTFGENYAQELVAKADAARELAGIRWHFIGHLQRNKVKDVLRAGAVVETVDSERLAEALARRAEGEGRRVEVFVEVNVGGEASKSGVEPSALPALVRAVRALSALELRGLMTIPPETAAPEDARPYFRRLRELATPLDLSELSMGMSADFEVAIEEGATLVRVGTALFGPRLATAPA